jgi:hypothetical protein
MTNERRGHPKVEKRNTTKAHLSDKAADLFLGGWETFDYSKHYNGKKK